MQDYDAYIHQYSYVLINAYIYTKTYSQTHTYMILGITLCMNISAYAH